MTTPEQKATQRRRTSEERFCYDMLQKYGLYQFNQASETFIEEFAAALREEREKAIEECAKIAQDQLPYVYLGISGVTDCGCGRDIAACIRALKEKV